jgi:Glycosyl transferases group 1
MVWKWRRVERRVQDTCDATIYAAGPDAHAARPHPPARVHTLPNGLFVGDDPPAVDRKRTPGKVIGFLGSMGYGPNISAVRRLAERIFPQVLQLLPNASLLVIGRTPPREVCALQSSRVTVTGEVAEIWTHVARADLFVFPMVEGAGMQNKIIEVMHAERPVVTTTISAAGIAAINAEQLLVGDTDEEIVTHILRLFADPELAAGLVARAQAFVRREYSPGPILSRYEAILAPSDTVPEKSGPKGYEAPKARTILAKVWHPRQSQPGDRKPASSRAEIIGSNLHCQQVNNAPQPGASRARESENQPNRLLEQRAMKAWTTERRKRQRTAIHRWKPWEQSTGPKTTEGKGSSALHT